MDSHVCEIILKPLTTLKTNYISLGRRRPGAMKRRNRPRNRAMAAAKQPLQHGDHANLLMRRIKALAGWPITRLSAHAIARSRFPKVNIVEAI
jgi:hypothetical protein